MAAAGFTMLRILRVVCFGEYTNRVLRKDTHQENRQQVNRFISFDLSFHVIKSSVNSSLQKVWVNFFPASQVTNPIMNIL